MVKERCDVEMAKSASKKLGLLFKCWNSFLTVSQLYRIYISKWRGQREGEDQIADERMEWKILSVWGLNIHEGERCAWDGLNWNVICKGWLVVWCGQGERAGPDCI